MRIALVALVLLVPAAAFGQQPPPPPPTAAQVQQWFESGQCAQVAQGVAVTPEADPKVLYLQGLCFEKLGRAADAARVYGQLAARPAEDPWPAVGRSAAAYAALPPVAPGAAAPPPPPPQPQAAGTPDPLAAATMAADQAIRTVTPPLPEGADPATAPAPTGPAAMAAFYQLGLLQGRRGENEAAAASFAKAAAADPTFAYAHYYAGLFYSRINRVDQTAIQWETFLKLAPKAPEAPQVMSILRTLRGR